MASERDKEREAELESAMYTNCLLLGLDPAVLGVGGSAPRAGHFRHSNPRMGEQLLYFLLSSLRGPVQSAKDFDKVWPIFDSAQSRDFRKIVQGIISELESQGALPRSNSRVSSLATCCGPRFVELLWQLSVHALREVHRRTFSADVASNPLPAPLTDISYSHAASLLPVSKARIALERRKFLKNANTAVQRQATWSNLAHEMTSEFRALCAEEAYLQQELEKLQDLRNKAKLEGEPWDDRVSSSSGQTSHMVSKATRLWESILARKGQHEILASGPIEDLIAHREHRYRISGSALRAAMDSSSQISSSDSSSFRASHLSTSSDGQDQADVTGGQGHNETISQADDRNGRVHQTVDVAEVLRRWTHALQRIHKQSMLLAKANDGEGPDLLQCTSDTGSDSHIDSLTATLAEHQQHLVSIQGLISQLKDAAPAMQKSISDLTEEVNRMSSLIPENEYNARAGSTIEAQSSGRNLEYSTDDIAEVTSKLSSTQLERPSSSPALKLPHLFSLMPNSSGKGTQTPKRPVVSTQVNQDGSFSERKSSSNAILKDHVDHREQGDVNDVQNLRRAVREAALSVSSSNGEVLPDKSITHGSQHFFMPLSTSTVPHVETKNPTSRSKQRLVFSSPGNRAMFSTDQISDVPLECKMERLPDFLRDSDGLETRTNGNKNHFPPRLDTSVDGNYFDVDEVLGQVLSPPLLVESSFFTDGYEDLLAPLSETEAALIDRSDMQCND